MKTFVRFQLILFAMILNFITLEGKTVCKTGLFKNVIVVLQPPASISGKQFKNKFLTQSDYINSIRWTRSPTKGVSSYNLFRNGVLIAVVPANQKLHYLDHDRSKGVSYVYSVTAVLEGMESTPIAVIVPLPSTSSSS